MSETQGETRTESPGKSRDWRAIGTELAIVVVGVALALAAQQAVDWLRWQGEVKAAREAIRYEVLLNHTNFSVRRIAYAPCLERQAVEAGRILDDLEAGRPPGRFTTFHYGAHTVLSENEWQSERSSQTLTHFPRAELAELGRHYAILPLFRAWMDQEADAWQSLSVLRQPPRGLAPGDLLPLRKALASAQWSSRLLVVNAERQLRRSRQIGIAEPVIEPVRREKFCTLDEEPWRQWIIASEKGQQP
jgi:hypothetical protein